MKRVQEQTVWTADRCQWDQQGAAQNIESQHLPTSALRRTNVEKELGNRSPYTMANL
jgi:hypothetical protein